MHDIFVSTQSINQFKHCEVASHFRSPIVSTRTIWRYFANRLLTLPAYSMHAEQGLRECPSVCLSHRSTAAGVAGGLAAERPVGRRYRSIAMGAQQRTRAASLSEPTEEAVSRLFTCFISLHVLGKLFTPFVPLFTKQQNW